MNLNKYIDHTVLKATATTKDIEKLCNEAVKYNFYAVCVNGCYVSCAKNLLKDSTVQLAAVVGFPLGAMDTPSKVNEAKEAVKNGATEIDMVINVAALLEGNSDLVYSEIKAIKDAIGSVLLKVIIETCYLSKAQIVEACELSVKANAEYVKTSTGFGTGGALLEDVKLMKDTVGDKALVKASGGIKTKEDAIKFVEAGADRLGTSSGIQIVSK